MPKDTLSQNLLSMIKTNKELDRLQKELKRERLHNKILAEENLGIRMQALTLQEQFDANELQLEELKTQLAVLLKEQERLKGANYALATYITQPFWQRWTQRLRFFLSS